MVNTLYSKLTTRLSRYKDVKSPGGVYLSGLLSLLLLMWLGMNGWVPFDDGVFAYVADQMNKGAIFGVDVYDNHGGYQHFLNAWLFEVFGSDMAVLRYPIFVMVAIQAMIAAYLCKKHGWLVSVLSGYAVTIFSFFMFPNSAPNWYALFFAFLVLWLLARYSVSWGRGLALGFVIGLCFMFRHPSAIFIGFAVLSFYIYESEVLKNQLFKFSRFFLLLMTASLLLYLFMAFELSAFLLYGGWAFLILGYLWFEKFGNDKELLGKILWSSAGLVLSFIPIVGYQFIYGDFTKWLSSSFFGGPSVFSSSLFSDSRYWHDIQHIFMDGIWVKLDPASLLVFAQGLAILVVPLIVGLILFNRIKNRQVIPPILFLVAFYGYVSIYVQLQPYFFFTFPLFILAIFQLSSWGGSHHKTIVAILFVVISSYGLFASPLSPLSIVKGSYLDSEIPKLSIGLFHEQKLGYHRLLSIIDEYVPVSEPILSFPNAPQVYYLSNRENLFPYHSGMFYVNTKEEYDQVRQKVEEEMPGIIVWSHGHGPADEERNLIEGLQSSGRYSYYESVADHIVYISNELEYDRDRVPLCRWYFEPRE